MLTFKTARGIAVKLAVNRVLSRMGYIVSRFEKL